MYFLTVMHNNLFIIFCVYLLSCSSAQKEVMKIPLQITTYNNISRCRSPHNLSPIEENQKIQVIANSDENFKNSNDAYRCFIGENEDSPPTETFVSLQIKQDRRKISSEERTFGSENSRKYLICNFDIDIRKPNEIVPDPVFPKAKCSIQLRSKSDPGEANGRDLGGDNNNTTIFIIVGVIVVLIIAGQTIALLYFRARTQVRNRLDSLVTHNRHFERNGEARYSAPPSRRNTKNNRAAADTDSHIYEMVGVNALYKDSSELDIKNRPPLPLPGESPIPPPVSIDTLPRPPKPKLMSSTLNLNSVSSKPVAPVVKRELPPSPVTTMKKPPCRPPKSATDSPTASLPRPPKPVTLSRPPKPGSSMPKMLPTDPGLMELKKALEKRSVRNAPSPPSSQQSTLEMQPKPPTKTQPPLTLAKPGKAPAGAINILAPNKKLIIPKIEATLKEPPAKPSMPEFSQFRKIEPAEAPSIPPVNPGLPPFRKPNPGTKASAVPTVPPQRPPHTRPTPQPLPPIQTEDDERHYSDDDEWTYEQLEKYNIYNV